MSSEQFNHFIVSKADIFIKEFGKDGWKKFIEANKKTYTDCMNNSDITDDMMRFALKNGSLDYTFANLIIRYYVTAKIMKEPVIQEVEDWILNGLLEIIEGNDAQNVFRLKPENKANNQWEGQSLQIKCYFQFLRNQGIPYLDAQLECYQKFGASESTVARINRSIKIPPASQETLEAIANASLDELFLLSHQKI